MAHNYKSKRYVTGYAALLRLYPKSYQKRFAEPMQQTFSDLCYERVRSGRDLFWFAVQTYAGTLVEIVKEQIKGAVMSSRATKIKFLAAAGGLSVLVAMSVFIYLNSNQPAQSFASGSYLEQVRELSKGKKEACLMDQNHVVDAVRADDGFYEFKDEKISKFESSAGVAIIDVPAGTEYKMTTHSYENGIVRGSMAYEYGYGIYNYEIKKLPDPGEWELVSVIACERA